MMKWGKKKNPSLPSSSASSSSSSSHSHLISHVFPRSWLSKFKQTREKPVSTNVKNNQNDVLKGSMERYSPRVLSSPRGYSGYYKDEDGFWRHSLGENNMGYDRKFAESKPHCENCKTNVEEFVKKKRVLEEVKKVPREEMIVRENEKAVKETRKEEILRRTYKRIMEATEELHRELDEVDVYRKSVEQDMSEQELLQVMQLVGKDDEQPSSMISSKSKDAFSREFDGGIGKKSNWKELKDAKIKQVMLKNEKQRKSFHVSRELNKQSNCNKVKLRSPRTPSKTDTCKIRAIEEMKRAKLKKKAKETEQEEKRAVELGSFAVVKRSWDPQLDFKESMVEMIMAKRITRAEELEELLACYLTLNADEYHDLIVKVFRQVWCELEQSQS